MGFLVQMHLMGYLDPKGTGVGESRKHRLASVCLRFVRFGSVRFGSVRFGLPSAKLFILLFYFIISFISFIYSFLSFILFSSF